MKPGAKALTNCRVLITRPAEQCADLAQLVADLDGQPIIFPVFNIELQSGSAAMGRGLKQLPHTDLAVFVSAHGVKAVLLACESGKIKFPENLAVAAIGPATAERLNQGGIRVRYLPDGTINSEGLLKRLQNIEFGGHRVLIFRGQSGRELLAESLQARGAIVEQIESYRRLLNPDSIRPAIKCWSGHGRQIAVISSVAIAHGLLQKIDVAHHQHLLAQPLVVFSERISEACRKIGFVGQINVAKRPDDQAVIDAMIEILKGASIKIN